MTATSTAVRRRGDGAEEGPLLASPDSPHGTFQPVATDQNAVGTSVDPWVVQRRKEALTQQRRAMRHSRIWHLLMFLFTFGLSLFVTFGSIYLFFRFTNYEFMEYPNSLAHVELEAKMAEDSMYEFHSAIPPSKKYRIAVCLKASDETPYLIEWIEFHRLQGVDKFAIYYDLLPNDPASAIASNQVVLLKSLYDKHVSSDIIDIMPSSAILPDMTSGLYYKITRGSASTHRIQQVALLSHCSERYRNEADWLLHIDTDEFLYTTPIGSSLWDYLNNNMPQHYTWAGKFMSAANPFRSVGVTFRPVTFGSSGQVFDFHTHLAANPFTGDVDVYFDPRDSTEFLMHSANLSTKKSEVVSAAVKTDVTVSSISTISDSLRLEYLNATELGYRSYVPKYAHVHTTSWVYNTSESRADELFEWMFPFRKKSEADNKILEEMFSQSIRNDPKLILKMNSFYEADSMIDEVQKLLDSEDKNVSMVKARRMSEGWWREQNARRYGSMISPVEQRILPILPPSQHSGRPFTGINDSDATNASGNLSNNFVVINDSSAKYSRQAFVNIVNELSAYERIAQSTLEWIGGKSHGPLHSASPEDRLKYGKMLAREWGQYYPMVSTEQVLRHDTGKLPKEKRRMVNAAIFSACGGNSTRKLFKGMCNNVGRMPSFFTAAGKAIYRTAAMERTESSRKTGRLRGCLRPWVHGCLHKYEGGVLHWASAREGIRLDHHQFRSLEKRTVGLPSWRGNELGYAGRDEYMEWMKWMSVSKDERKIELAKKVRTRIINQFQPIPKFFLYQTVKDAPWRHSYNPIGMINTCSPLELLLEKQILCPNSHPFTGLGPLNLNPPSVFQPYLWCTRTDRSVMRESIWDGQFKPIMNSATDTTSVEICPGWPEIPCCSSMVYSQSEFVDLHNSSFAVLSSSKFSRPISMPQ